MINENVLWYGLQLKINDKKFTLARGRLVEGKVSKNYYFSSSGELPKSVVRNNTEKALKLIFESEFSIDSNVKIPYGSSLITSGSKISLRYFLMFNTISGNIIESNSGVFFDKQNEKRYSDALPRIFDLAVGIETVDNILKKEKRQELKNKKSRLERKIDKISNKSEDFEEELTSIIRTAKEFGLIPADLGMRASLEHLNGLVHGDSFLAGDNNELAKLEHKRLLIERKIKNLNRFVDEYEAYKNNLINTGDSLKPIDFLIDHDREIIKTSIFNDLFDRLSNDLLEIKKSYGKSTPIDGQIADEIKLLSGKLELIDKEISILPVNISLFESEREKYFFLGETKSKLSFYYKSKKNKKEDNSDLQKIEDDINAIDIYDTSEKRDIIIKLAEEIIATYFEESGTALGNYSNFKPVFDYWKKSLVLRKPGTSFIEPAGSSSNHMFLQLFFTLSVHELAFKNESKYVAPLIIIDQPSRPYYGEEDVLNEHSDEAKIKKAFLILSNFIASRKKNNGEFQMIVLEHIPNKLIKKLDNVHIVETFRDGNALIPDDLLL